MTKKPSFSPRQYNAYKSGIIPLALIDSNFYFCKRVQYHVSKFAWDCVNPSSFLIEQWCKLSDEGLFLHRIWKEKAFFLLIRFSGSLVYEFTIVFLFSLHFLLFQPCFSLFHGTGFTVPPLLPSIIKARTVFIFKRVELWVQVKWKSAPYSVFDLAGASTGLDLFWNWFFFVSWN